MIPLIVIGIALAITALLVLAEWIFGDHRPLDTEVQERWLVRHAPQRLRPAFRHVDRRVAGGIAIAASLLVVTVGGVVVGSIFDSLDEERGLARFDQAAGEFGARNATAWSTRILGWLTELGGTTPLLVVMGLIGVIEVVRRQTWGPLLYLASAGVGIVVVNNALKLIVDRERPEIAQLTGHAGSSFPSGHSAAAAACWAAIALVLLRRSSPRARAAGAAGAVLIAVTVATTRVLLGVHWLTDVVAGVIVGWAWFGVLTLIFGGRLLRLGEPVERVAHDGGQDARFGSESATSRSASEASSLRSSASAR